MAHTSHDITIGHLQALASSFWDRVDIRSDNECWHWTKGRNRRGYGVVHIPMRITGFSRPVALYAHRVALALAEGELPDPGLSTDHLCYTLNCCNPAHLQSVTQMINVRRGRKELHPIQVGRPDAPRWQVRFRTYAGPKRRQLSKTFGTEADALDFIARLKAERKELP